MNNKIHLIIVFIICMNQIIAQNIKYSISTFYQPYISKTNLTDDRSFIHNSKLYPFFSSNSPNKPINGVQYGFKAGMIFIEKFGIELGYNKTTRGQRTRKEYFEKSDQNSFSIFEEKANDLFLQFNIEKLKIKKLNFRVFSGFILSKLENVVELQYLENSFIISKPRYVFYLSNSFGIHYRCGVLSGIDILLLKNKYFQIFAGSKLNYYFPSFNVDIYDNARFAITGNAYTIGVNLELQYNFTL